LDQKTEKEEGSNMKERNIEAYGVREIERAGGTCEKFTSPGRRAVPDRICSLRPGKVFFIEFKAPGEKPTPAQIRDHERRHARGFRIYVVSRREAMAGIIYRELGL
jgi:hypothetical protein